MGEFQDYHWVSIWCIRPSCSQFIKDDLQAPGDFVKEAKCSNELSSLLLLLAAHLRSGSGGEYQQVRHILYLQKVL